MATSGTLTRAVSIWVIPGLKAPSLSVFILKHCAHLSLSLLSSKREGEPQAQSRHILSNWIAHQGQGPQALPLWCKIKQITWRPHQFPVLSDQSCPEDNH
jgi:hypothetical protein